MSSHLASLTLAFRTDGPRTLLARSHRGPLTVQKALYPEGDALCHAVLVHPPGGIAGGDEIAIDATVEAGAQALITTPGAAKWYKADGRGAAQRVRLTVRGALEWLPQEAIVFDQAQVDSRIDIELSDSASMLGWDIVALGRAAAGETFAQGRFAQTIRLRHAGRLQWIERTRIDGDDALLASPIGLAGRHVFGCLWAAGPQLASADFDALRARLDAQAAPELTRLTPQLWVARTLGAGTQPVREALQTLWAELRPIVLGRAAIAPRIWAT
ncbi:MAG: urease accessory protein UreD [Betaproteobacteria bacterium]